MKTNLKKLRERKGWTLERLAEESGVSTSQVSRIERGESFPSAESMIGICKALNCTPVDIYMTDAMLDAYQLACEIKDLSPEERTMVERMVRGEPRQPKVPHR